MSVHKPLAMQEKKGKRNSSKPNDIDIILDQLKLILLLVDIYFAALISMLVGYHRSAQLIFCEMEHI